MVEHQKRHLSPKEEQFAKTIGSAIETFKFAAKIVFGKSAETILFRFNPFGATASQLRNKYPAFNGVTANMGLGSDTIQAVKALAKQKGIKDLNLENYYAIGTNTQTEQTVWAHADGNPNTEETLHIGLRGIYNNEAIPPPKIVPRPSQN